MEHGMDSLERRRIRNRNKDRLLVNEAVIRQCNLRFFLAIIVIALFAACPATYSNPTDSRIATNSLLVTELLSEIKNYKDSHGRLPSRIEDVARYVEIMNQYIGRKVKYDVNGIRDISGRKWLVAVSDNKLMDVYFVGDCEEKMIIVRNITKGRPVFKVRDMAK